MLTNERFDKIMAIVSKNKSASVSLLAQQLDVSESTIRRDITALADMNLLRRVHGGATLVGNVLDVFLEPTMEHKSLINVAEKECVGKYAATLVNDNDFIYLDAGTTTEKFIDFLPETKAVFVTNGLTHARKLAKKGIDTIILGGTIKGNTEAIVGSEAIDSLRKYNFTKCFIGSNAISTNCGFTTPDINEAKLKECAIEHSYISYVLCDHSKFNKETSVTFAELDSCCIITDYLPDQEYADICVYKEVDKI